MAIKVISVVGARPNYMKIAPVMQEMKKYPQYFSPLLVHTGQHYHREMNELFFEELKMPRPDINLKVGSATHAEQTATIMARFEKVVMRENPSLVVVAGDVNSTLACALVAAKLHIKIAHIESGLRSFDMHMPEEINRKLTDVLSSYLFTPSLDANRNLIKEGAAASKIYFVGNIMIDTLLRFKEIALRRETFKKYGVTKKGFCLLTLHRPENVDNKNNFQSILSALGKISDTVPILFPIHPRTQQKIKTFGLGGYFQNKAMTLLKPLGYLDFVNLMINSRFILTDSGGIQEESAILKIPCLTLRNNTERPVTVECGTNTVTGINPQKILQGFRAIMDGRKKVLKVPKYWDGKAAQRIVNILKNSCKR